MVALPALLGPRIPGLPDDGDGFIPIDEQCRVQGLDEVFAAGDAAAFAVKHGSLATQQADAAASAIAAACRRDRRARAVPSRAARDAADRRRPALHPPRRSAASATVSSEPLWTPAGKIVGRYISPFLTPPLQR